MTEIAVEDYAGIGEALATAEAKGYKAGLRKAVEVAEEAVSQYRDGDPRRYDLEDMIFHLRALANHSE